MGESWYGTDDKAWGVVGVLLAVMLMVVGLAAGCESAGSSPEHPIYYRCEEK